MKTFIKFSLTLIIGLFFYKEAFPYYENETPFEKNLRGTLKECNDRENYNSDDCDKTIALKKFIKDYDNLPDSQRLRLGSLGEEILVEKKTGLRLGEFLIKKNGKILRELRIEDEKEIYGFKLGAAAGCRDNLYRILESNSQFIFLVETCFSSDYKEDLNHLIFYDKKIKSAFSIIRTPQPLIPEPTLRWKNGIYFYRWNYIFKDKVMKKNSYTLEYYDIKVHPTKETYCNKMWNDDCPISRLEKRVIQNP